MSILFPCIMLWKELIHHLGESFVIFTNARFQKWLGFLLMDVWEVAVVLKVWRSLTVVSFKF